MSCDLSIVLHVAYEGSALIVLFLDMRNAVSSHFVTVQVSVQVFTTKKTRMEGHNLCVTYFAITGMCWFLHSSFSNQVNGSKAGSLPKLHPGRR